jgi:hypothetical protein
VKPSASQQSASPFAGLQTAASPPQLGAQAPPAHCRPLQQSPLVVQEPSSKAQGIFAAQSPPSQAPQQGSVEPQL